MAGGQQTQYVTMSAGQPGMQQQRIMQQQGQQQPMTPGLRQILQQQQQQQPGMMNMMQQGGMQANNQVFNCQALCSFSSLIFSLKMDEDLPVITF